MDSCEPVKFGRRSDPRCRRADAYLNFSTKKEISKRNAQWRDKGMQLLRRAPSNLWGGAIDVVSSVKAADERNRILAQELPPDEESLYKKDAHAAKKRDLDAWSQFKVSSHMGSGKCGNEEVGNRRVLTWKAADGVENVKARLAA